MPTTPTKEAQAAEGAAREAATLTPIPAGETTLATETIADAPATIATPAPPPGQPTPEPAAPKLPTVRTMGNDKRDAITARFRTERTVEAEGDGDDITTFARSNGMPPEFANEPEPAAPLAAAPEPPAAPEPAEPEPAEPAPRLHKVTVNGKDMELTEAELVAHAQKALASNEMFDVAKDRLKQVDALLADARNRVARGDPPGAHQPGQPTQPTGTPAPESGTPTEDPISRLIETFQFGAAEDAKPLLQHTIAAIAAPLVQEAVQSIRFNDEAKATRKVLTEFEAANADLANDKKTRAWISQDIVDQQEADLRRIGIDPGRIRSDGAPATPADITNAHQYLRTQGADLHSPAEMLVEGVKHFQDWRGIKPPNPAPAPAPTPTPRPANAQRVEVTVDRTVRRQAIPQQPTPAAAPRPNPAQPPAPPADRSSVVERIKASRAKGRGQNLGL